MSKLTFRPSRLVVKANLVAICVMYFPADLKAATCFIDRRLVGSPCLFTPSSLLHPASTLYD